MSESSTAQALQTNAAICDVDGCGEMATTFYMWDWGQKGACCDKHAAFLRQRSGHLERAVHFSPIAPNQPAPLTRDERIAHHATHLADSEEIAALKAHGAEMYNQNTRLNDECRRLTARNQQLEIQLKDALSKASEACDSRDDLQAKHNDAITELQRLQLLVSAPHS